MAVAAAAFLSFFATLAASEVTGCEVRRELLIADGSPLLGAAREALHETYRAQVYLQLAQDAKGAELRREYAYLAILAVNEAILHTTNETEAKLWSFPSDAQLSTRRYFDETFSRIRRLDVHQLRATLRTVDTEFAENMGELSDCDRVASVGDLLAFIAVLLSVVSVVLITLREHHRPA